MISLIINKHNQKHTDRFKKLKKAMVYSAKLNVLLHFPEALSKESEVENLVLRMKHLLNELFVFLDFKHVYRILFVVIFNQNIFP